MFVDIVPNCGFGTSRGWRICRGTSININHWGHVADLGSIGDFGGGNRLFAETKTLERLGWE